MRIDPLIKKILLLSISIAIIIGSGGVTYWLLNVYYKPVTVQERFIKIGDKVDVDYIGYYPDTGLIFDTSMYSVASNNDSYPKAPDFSFRGETEYTFLKVYVGSASGGNVEGYGQMIEGFWKALIGLKKGDTRTVLVPPELGYGEKNPELIKKIPIIEEIPIKVVVTTEQFSSTFSVSPVINGYYKHPFWKWNVTIFSIFGNEVIYLNQPEYGSILNAYGWKSKIISIDSSANNGDGVIKVQHELHDYDAYRVKGIDQTKTPFYVIKVDKQNGTITIDYNKQTTGRNIAFTITVRDIKK